MNCIICDSEIKPIEDSNDEKGMWLDGIVDKISANYGSKFDGDMFLIAVCDNCLESKKEKIKYLGNYME